ncbi:MAG: hypothetical protein JO168_01455 [Solirubrobacterales bacterium]|nr:hypothetical protein [Solirubrobacterales bacterium]MBV9715875.1 hypothetical protein [Solirubrobacterales bacterium]
MYRRTLLLLMLGVGLALLGAPVASARVTLSRPLTMDVYAPLYNYFSQPVASPTKLGHHLYVAVVRGTVSFYQPMDYLSIQVPWTVMCGRPQPAPMFSSAGGTGKVGNDAEFLFAQPLSGRPCSAIKLPREYPNFQSNVGKGWTHPNLVSRSSLRGPTVTHTYEFGLDGQGKQVSFRIIDPDTRDDYGSFRIYLRDAVRSDCAGNGHAAFFLSLKACLADTPDEPAPSLPPAPRPLTLDQSTVTRVLRSSDVPTAINGEAPSGALTADRFAQVDNVSAAAAAAESKLLRRDGFVAGAISEFHGLKLPSLKSTAAKFASPAQAQKALGDELALAGRTQAPGGTTAGAPQPDADLPGTFLIPFSPGSLELLAAKGDYVFTLVGVANPSPVSQPAEEQQFALLLGRS